MKKYYRVCHKDTLQGLWYDYKGSFTGLIHGKFNFCVNNNLTMEFDEELVGWLSATDSLETLYHWFPIEDIVSLQEHGWFIFEFEANDVKFYERFQHQVIKQDTSKVIRMIEISKGQNDLIKFLPHSEDEYQIVVENISDKSVLEAITRNGQIILNDILKFLDENKFEVPTTVVKYEKFGDAIYPVNYHENGMVIVDYPIMFDKI